MSDLSSLNLNVEEEAKDAEGGGSLPLGKHLVVVTASEVKETKAGNGLRLAYNIQCIEGECEGVSMASGFNIEHSNPEAARIGRAQLAQLCLAVGVTNPKNSEELHDKPVWVTIKPNRKDNKPEVGRFDAYEGAAQASKHVAAKPAPAPAPTAAAAKPVPPWKKK
jgi:hypothetical protein